jgi:hypothetical protein
MVIVSKVKDSGTPVRNPGPAVRYPGCNVRYPGDIVRNPGLVKQATGSYPQLDLSVKFPRCRVNRAGSAGG